MLCGTGLSIPSYTKVQHSLVGKALDRDRIDAWQQTLTRRQIEIFERLNGSLLEQLGYDLISSPRSRHFGLAEKAFLIAKDQMKRAINYFKFQWRHH